MKKSFKNIISTGLVVFGLLFISNAYAQIGFPDDVDDENPTVPIDGLLVAGLVAGTALGYKKLRR
ncbi:PID-CTERM protein-sorting domain-containing protein [Haloflavibacter putidus]|uniref:PEP-CTERM protein-sorting domain-containing protein n=1 Tax=Haloflavibacter putidus TaxID=2576776 RepID=A0A507ZBQ1_9FLAO|nr:hypothetical protein [Haloflavibacter putidus]TQD34337.1 hypothetical protein FKR84_11905 [Haloflavibacter putidus]